MSMKTLATSKTCGPCMVLKNKIKALNLEVDIKDFTIEEDREFFLKHNLRAVPRLVVEDGDTVEIIQGMDEIIEALKNE